MADAALRGPPDRQAALRVEYLGFGLWGPQNQPVADAAVRGPPDRHAAVGVGGEDLRRRSVPCHGQNLCGMPRHGHAAHQALHRYLWSGFGLWCTGVELGPCWPLKARPSSPYDLAGLLWALTSLSEWRPESLRKAVPWTCGPVGSAHTRAHDPWCRVQGVGCGCSVPVSTTLPVPVTWPDSGGALRAFSRLHAGSNGTASRMRARTKGS